MVVRSSLEEITNLIKYVIEAIIVIVKLFLHFITLTDVVVSCLCASSLGYELDNVVGIVHLLVTAVIGSLCMATKQTLGFVYFYLH